MRASAATVAVATVSMPSLLAKSADASGLSAAEFGTLMKFTRDLFPHDRLDDSYYAKALAPLLDEFSKARATQTLLFSGIAELNAATMASVGASYADVGDESVRVAAIKKVEGGAFFHKVYDSTMTPLYNQPALWARFGYEGPSSAAGGYLNRGFSDIDWLPEK
jgi:hypothetical protein